MCPGHLSSVLGKPWGSLCGHQELAISSKMERAVGYNAEQYKIEYVIVSVMKTAKHTHIDTHTHSHYQTSAGKGKKKRKKITCERLFSLSLILGVCILITL